MTVASRALWDVSQALYRAADAWSDVDQLAFDHSKTEIGRAIGMSVDEAAATVHEFVDEIEAAEARVATAADPGAQVNAAMEQVAAAVREQKVQVATYQGPDGKLFLSYPAAAAAAHVAAAAVPEPEPEPDPEDAWGWAAEVRPGCWLSMGSYVLLTCQQACALAQADADMGRRRTRVSKAGSDVPPIILEPARALEDDEALNGIAEILSRPVRAGADDMPAILDLVERTGRRPGRLRFEALLNFCDEVAETVAKRGHVAYREGPGGGGPWVATRLADGSTALWGTSGGSAEPGDTYWYASRYGADGDELDASGLQTTELRNPDDDSQEIGDAIALAVEGWADLYHARERDARGCE